jgi:soluble lytic murein transglycosylase-like protein
MMALRRGDMAALAGLTMLAAGGVAVAAEPATATEPLAALRQQGQALEHGEGVARSPQQAIELYCRGARLGDAEAQYRLGWIYANGRGVSRDDRVASYFFGLAARQGHKYAMRMMDQVGYDAAPAPKCMREADSYEPGNLTLDGLPPAQRRIGDLVSRLAPQYGVDPRLAFAVIRAESNFDPAAVSARNAQGLMQLLPETSLRFRVRKPFDPEQNIRGGLAYLRWLLAYYRGDVILTAAAYNAGEGTVSRYGGVPPYPETISYVKRIRRLFGHDRHPFDPSVVEPSPELARLRARVI